jgi:hypothetical protein
MSWFAAVDGSCCTLARRLLVTAPPCIMHSRVCSNRCLAAVSTPYRHMLCRIYHAYNALGCCSMLLQNSRVLLTKVDTCRV